jgi:hypothetical protein
MPRETAGSVLPIQSVNIGKRATRPLKPAVAVRDDTPGAG